MLGYDAGKIGAPYRKVVFRSSVAALVLALVAVLGMRLAYLHALKGLDIEPGSVVPAIVSGIVLTLLIIIFNLSSIRKRIKSSWRKE